MTTHIQNDQSILNNTPIKLKGFSANETSLLFKQESHVLLPKSKNTIVKALKFLEP